MISWGRLLERPYLPLPDSPGTVGTAPGKTPQELSQDADRLNVGGLGGPNRRKGHTMTTEELRAKFARKAMLSDEHHDALTKLEPTDGGPVVLYDLGTDLPAYGRSWS